MILVAALCLTASLTGCLGNDGCPSSSQELERQLERQPAALVTSLDGGFLVGVDRSTRCSAPGAAEALLLDPATGAPRWRRPIPWSTRLITVGDTVVAAGTAGERFSASVAAMDLATGKPRWQRFFAATSIGLMGAGETTVVVTVMERSSGGRQPVRLVALEVKTGRTVWERPFARATDFTSWPRATSRERAVDVLSGRLDGPFRVLQRGIAELFVLDITTGEERPLPETSGALVDGDHLVTVRGGVVELFPTPMTTAPLWSSTPLPFDETFTGVVDLIAGNASIVAVIGSHRGPDRRLVVLDVGTGQVRWQVDGARRAITAGGTLLLQRGAARNGDLVTQVVGRNLVTGEEQWIVDRSLGLTGYLGQSKGRVLFRSSPTSGTELNELNSLDPSTGRGLMTDPAAGQSMEPAGSRAVVDDQLILVDGTSTPDRARTIQAYNAGDLVHRWTMPFDRKAGQATITDRGVVVAAYTELLGHD